MDEYERSCGKKLMMAFKTFIFLKINQRQHAKSCHGRGKQQKTHHVYYKRGYYAKNAGVQSVRSSVGCRLQTVWLRQCFNNSRAFRIANSDDRRRALEIPCLEFFQCGVALRHLGV